MPGFAFTTKNINIHKRRKKKSFWKRLNNVFMKKNWRKNPNGYTLFFQWKDGNTTLWAFYQFYSQIIKELKNQ